MLHPKRPMLAAIAFVAVLVVILAALGGAALQRQNHSPTRVAGWTWDDSAAAD